MVHSFPQQSSVSAGEYGLKYGVLRSSRSRLDMKEYRRVYNTPEPKDSRTYAGGKQAGFRPESDTRFHAPNRMEPMRASPFAEKLPRPISSLRASPQSSRNAPSSERKRIQTDRRSEHNSEVIDARVNGAREQWPSPVCARSGPSSWSAPSPESASWTSGAQPLP